MQDPGLAEKNSLIYRLCTWLGKLLHHPWPAWARCSEALPLVWKTVLFCGGCIAMECFCLYQLFWDGNVVPIILLNLLVCLVLLSAATHLKKAPAGLPGHRRRPWTSGWTPNSCARTSGPRARPEPHRLRHRRGGGGKLKSERFKTEAHHQCLPRSEGPLTSIVNYVDLLSKLELPQDARGYGGVLRRQSARLKKLTEDLVEASQGVHRQPERGDHHRAAGRAGEPGHRQYEDRFQKAGLYPVLQLPEGKIPALGDGRYLWRIMDNLFSNVCNMPCPAPGCISTPPSRTAMPSST